MSRLEALLFLATATCLLFVTSGCAANRAGDIGVSTPRVWQDHAVVTTIGMQLDKIDKFEEGVDLAAIQGMRARRYYQARALMGALSGTVPSPATPGTSAPTESGAESPKAELPEPTTPKVFPTERQSPGLTFDDFSKIFKEIKEDPMDGLQRVDDFYQIFGGMRLTHLRDTASMQKGWSVYLLGFDISLVPGDKTSQDHGAYVEFTITGKNGDVSDEDVYVYNVWPQRYAERFDETLSLREDFYLALKGAAKGQQWAAQMAQNLAQRYEEDLALIQRYPLISGFVRGASCFGWEFNPRVRIETKERFLRADRPEPVYWMEPGVRRCYALVAVKDNRIEVDRVLLQVGKEELKKIAFRGKAWSIDIAGLKGMYEKVLDQVPDDPPSLKEERDRLENELTKLNYLGIKAELDEWSAFEESLKTWQDKHDELIGLMDSATRADHRDLCELGVKDFKRIASNLADIQNIQGRYISALAAVKQIPNNKVSPLLENYFGTLDKRVVIANPADLKKWGYFSETLSDWEKFHISILGLREYQGKGGKRELELITKGHWFNRHNGKEVKVDGEILGTTPNPMIVKLPNKLGGTLQKIWAVWPETGLINHKTTVTIKGQNFSHDARVFIGGIEIDPKDVSVASRNSIVATFPPIDAALLEGKKEKKFTVKVITEGDSLTAREAFTYVKPEKPTPTPFKAWLDSSTTRGAINASVKIIANESVMDRVREVWFGPYMVVPDSMARSKGDTELTVSVPAGPVTKTTPTGPKAGTKVHITLKFYPQTDITPNDEYVLPTPFTYE